MEEKTNGTDRRHQQEAGKHGITAQINQQYLARLANGSYEQDGNDIIAEIKAHPRLITTKEASQIFGLSEYELRRGFKAGIYPAIQIGTGEFRKIKWRYDLLEEVLKNKNSGKGELNNGL